MSAATQWLLWALLAAAASAAGAGRADDSVQLCIAFLSYNRPHYLIPSVREFMKYTRKVEPQLQYVIQILDNGSGQQELQDIQQGLAALKAPNIRLVHLNKTVGLARGFNLLFYDMCGGYDYILSLEDDWQAKDTWPASLPVLQSSMQLLQNDSNLLEVWIRDFHVSKGIHQYHGWQPATATVQGQEVGFSINHITCPVNSIWGVYTNGASVKYMPRLQQLGRQPTQHGNGQDGEEGFAALACKSNLHSALLCAGPGSECLRTGWFKDTYISLFEHIGHKRVSVEKDSRYSELLDRAEEVVENETLHNVAHVELPVSYLCQSVGRLAQCETVLWSDSSANSGSRTIAQHLQFIASTATGTAQNCTVAWTILWVLLLAVSVVVVYVARRSKGRFISSPLLKL